MTGDGRKDVITSLYQRDGNPRKLDIVPETPEIFARELVTKFLYHHAQTFTNRRKTDVPKH